MRCVITYRRGPFWGSLDFGVLSEDDPRVEAKCAEMRASGSEIIKIGFW